MPLDDLVAMTRVISQHVRGHRFLPPVDERAVAAAERELGCALPAAYRRFVTEVSEGEEDARNEATLRPLRADLAPVASFPVSREREHALGEAARRARATGARAPAVDLEVPSGTKLLVDQGDTVVHLVVAGPCAGSIWQEWDEGWTPRTGDGGIQDFLSFAREYLEPLAALAEQKASRREIDLRGQLDGRWPEDVADRSDATVLRADRNGLAELPDAIATFTELRELGLAHNQLTSLPDCFAGLSQLEWLDLRHNRLAALPPSLGRLSSLRRLLVSHNPLRELVPMAGLRRLTTIDVEDTRLEALPDGFGALPLRSLRLTDLPLDWSRCSALFELPAIERLYLVGLGLTEVPEGLARLKTLVSLGLDRNELATLPDFVGELPRLQKVILRRNPIDDATVARLRERWPHLSIKAR